MPFRKNILLFLITFLVSCKGQNTPAITDVVVTDQTSFSESQANGIHFNATSTQALDNSIRSIFQDKSGNFWFGTNGSGVYRYDGKMLSQFTVTDGLCNNQVQNIQEDNAGNLWFGTGAFGVSRFDGQTFTTLTDSENLRLSNGFDSDGKMGPDDLWFNAGGGVYRYSVHSLVYLPFVKRDFGSEESQNSPFVLSRYGVYCTLKDTKGNIWIGTQAQGVCRYDGVSFTWFTEKGLAGSAVLGLFEDSKGNIWFGNNGAGLFRYDGKSVLNFTEDKGLGNSEFKATGKSDPATLARVYTINEDNDGNLWIGTVDAGVWRYDGNNLKNYTSKDGLTGNAINCIYKDQNGELWFGTDEDGICKFDGMTFTKFEIR